MFGPHDDPPSLRQGDIVADLFFPLPRQAAVQYMASRTEGNELNLRLEPVIDQPAGARRRYLTGVTSGIVSHGAVISQCCDLDRTHPKTSFVVCRLLPFDRARYRNPDTLAENVNPYGPINPHFQFFYLGQIQGLPGEQLADFAFTLTVPWETMN